VVVLDKVLNGNTWSTGTHAALDGPDSRCNSCSLPYLVIMNLHTAFSLAAARTRGESINTLFPLVHPRILDPYFPIGSAH
jgi:hypothetical protein